MVGVGSNTPAPYLGATGKTEEGGDTGVVERWRGEGGKGGGANSLPAMSPRVNLSPGIVQMGVIYCKLP